MKLVFCSSTVYFICKLLPVAIVEELRLQSQLPHDSDR